MKIYYLIIIKKHRIDNIQYENGKNKSKVYISKKHDQIK